MLSPRISDKSDCRLKKGTRNVRLIIFLFEAIGEIDEDEEKVQKKEDEPG